MPDFHTYSRQEPFSYSVCRTLQIGDGNPAGLQRAWRASPLSCPIVCVQAGESWRFLRGSGVEKVFLGCPAVEMKSQFLSQTWFPSALGLCREPGFTLCVPQMRWALEKESCYTQEGIKLVLYLGMRFKNSTSLKLWKPALNIITCGLSMEKYVLSGNLMAEVILHPWGVKCAVLRDLCCSAEETRVAFLSFRRKRYV